MAQTFDKSLGCLTVTPYLILVTEDTTVTVGEGACTVTITAAEGQRVVWTDSAAKLTLSTDSARYEQLPKSAPLPLGQGGTPLNPAEKEAVENLAAGTISHAGALNVHASSILTYGSPIDTMGGDVYHRDGSATFAGTEGGHDYSAVIDFKHFEVRKDGELIVHFHESNNEPVLELGSSRVLTEEYVIQQAETAMTSKVDGLDNIEELAPSSFGTYVSCVNGRYLNVNGEFVFPASNKLVSITCTDFRQGAYTEVVIVAPNADVFVNITGGDSFYSRGVRLTKDTKCRSFTCRIDSEFYSSVLSVYSGDGLLSDLPVTLIAPSLSKTRYASFANQPNLRTLRVYAPSWAMADTNFFATEGAVSPLSKESVLYTLKHFGLSDGTGKVLHIGIDKTLVSIDPDTQVATLLDPELQAAHDAKVAAGWSVEYVPSA